MRSCTALALALSVLAAGSAAAVVQWVEAVALEGDAAPGTGGGSFASFGAAVQHESGDVAFTAQLSGGSAAEGIFALPFAGSLAPIALAGDPSPFPGQDYAAFPYAVDLIQDPHTGEAVVAFHAILSQSPIHEGIAIAQGGSHTAVVELLDPAHGSYARIGDPAPDTGAGAFSAFPFGPSVNEFADVSGVVTFSAEVSGGTASSGVFRLPEPGVGIGLLAGGALLGMLGASRRRRCD